MRFLSIFISHDVLFFLIDTKQRNTIQKCTIKSNTLREKCPYSELFWSAFSRIRNEYGEIFRISPYSVRMRENADQNNSEHGHFLRSDIVMVLTEITTDEN